MGADRRTRTETQDLLRRVVGATAFVVGCLVVSYVIFFVPLPEGHDDAGQYPRQATLALSSNNTFRTPPRERVFSCDRMPDLLGLQRPNRSAVRERTVG